MSLKRAKPFAGQEGWRYGAESEAALEGEEAPPVELPAPTTDVGQDLRPYLEALLESAQRQEQLLARILQELRQQVQLGAIYGPAAINVPTTTPVDITFDPPLFALSLTNDGAGAVQYRLPNRADADWVNLLPTEVDNYTFIKALVPSVAFRVLGAAASVRVKGIR